MAEVKRRRKTTVTGIAPSEPERDILDQYLYEVSTYPLLKGTEEIDVARRIRAGDPDALQELVQRNLRFVIPSREKQTAHPSSIFPARATSPVTLRSSSIPTGRKSSRTRLWWIRRRFSRGPRAGRSCAAHRTADLSRLTGVGDPSAEDAPRADPQSFPSHRSLGGRRQSLAAATRRRALDAPMDPEGDRSLIERFVADEMPDTEEEAMNRFLNDEIETALSTLPPRDAKVLRLYFGLEGGREHTLEEIGSLLGVTRERVRQLRDRALKRLREGDVGRALGSFAA